MRSKPVAVSVAMLCMSMLLTTCAKEYSFEGGAGQPSLPPGPSPSPDPNLIASFAFEGSPATCSGANVQGIYTVGIALDATNYVELKVNVGVTGAYNISTDTVNGIYFSGTGNFASTGAQTILLTGNGRPVETDSVTLHPAAKGVAGCGFKVGILNKQPIATYVLESGFAATCNHTQSGNYTRGITLTAADDVTVTVFVANTGNFTIATETVNGMRFYRSDVFTKTGSQLVTLSASGTPVGSGKYNFVTRIIGPHPLGGQACGFAIDVK